MVLYGSLGEEPAEAAGLDAAVGEEPCELELEEQAASTAMAETAPPARRARRETPEIWGRLAREALMG